MRRACAEKAGQGGRDYKRPIPLLTDKAQKIEITYFSCDGEDANPLGKIIQAQMATFLADQTMSAQSLRRAGKNGVMIYRDVFRFGSGFRGAMIYRDVFRSGSGFSGHEE